MDYLKLTNENIDLLSEKLGEMYLRLTDSQKEAMRARLLLEEALIKYQANFGEDTEICYKEYRVLSQNHFLIKVRSESFDPFTADENQMAFMMRSVLSSIEGNAPVWKYHNKENEIVFTVFKKAKINGAVKILTAVAFSALAGIAAKTFFDSEELKTFVGEYLTPLADTYAGLFCVMAVLLTFFAVVLSIVHMGDMAMAGKVGGRIMRRFYAMTTVLVVLLTIPAVLTVPSYLLKGQGSIPLTIKSLYDILIGFIPSNLVSPFLNFNSMHIVLIGVMFGFSLLYMGRKGENLVHVFDECNLVAVFTNSFLNQFIYIYVAIKIFELIVSNEILTFSIAAKLVTLVVIGELTLLLFYTVYVCIKAKIPLKKYLKAVLPAFLVCLSSANFGAAYSTCVESLQNLKAFEDRTNLCFVLGGVVFRPACTLVFVFSAITMASFYKIVISPVWIAMAIFLSILLVAAVPNIPGVSVAVISLLYTQLGLPEASVTLMIAINAPLQFLTVAVDTYCLIAEATCLSKWKIEEKRS